MRGPDDDVVTTPRTLREPEVGVEVTNAGREVADVRDLALWLSLVAEGDAADDHERWIVREICDHVLGLEGS